MAINTAFIPSYGSGQVVSAGAAAASITIGKGSSALCITNSGANIAYVRVGSGSATTADYPVPAGSQKIIGKSTDDSTLSHISAAGTTLHIMAGEGM